MQRCSRPVSAETRSRTSVLPLFRLSGSAEPKSERAAPVFVTGWKSRESLSAPVAEITDMATAVQKIIRISSCLSGHSKTKPRGWASCIIRSAITRH
jgi:hypothetical protein